MTDFRTDDQDQGAKTTDAGTYRRAADEARKQAATLREQATDRARTYAVDGKARAGEAIDGFADLIDDAARQIDERLGDQYAGYARSAAEQVHGLADYVRDRDVDELVADVRDFVRKSPGVAIGVAAAAGFVIARIVRSGFEEAKVLGTDPARPRARTDHAQDDAR